MSESREKKILKLINDYKEKLKNDESMFTNEIIKWQLVERYKGRPATSAADLYTEVKSVSYNNLIWPLGKRTLEDMARKNPEDLRKILNELFDERETLENRISSFIEESEILFRKVNPDITKKAFQDERQISAYLTYMYPDKYTFYKSDIYSNYCKYLEIQSEGKNKKYVHYLELIKELSQYIEKDLELTRLIHDKLPDDAYKDPDHLVLAQDIVFQTFFKDKDKGEAKMSLKEEFANWLIRNTNYFSERKDRKKDTLGALDFYESRFDYDVFSCSSTNYKEIGQRVLRDVGDEESKFSKAANGDSTAFAIMRKHYIKFLEDTFGGINETKTEIPAYWTFKHKPGSDANEEGCLRFVEWAIKLNSALMQYEYNNQENDKVTLNWNIVAFDIKEGDYIFLRGDERIYAVGKVIKPRKEPNVVLNAEEVIRSKNHKEHISGKYSGCIHFEDSEVFYEDLSDGDWGQRIDVDSWMYYNPIGINVKSTSLYLNFNRFAVANKLKDEYGKKFFEQLRGEFMGQELELLKSNYNLILTGAPGTGKTFLAREMALKLIFGKDDEDLLSEEEKERFEKQIRFVQFHPSYDYSDFVEGFRPVEKADNNIGFTLKNGIFRDFCKDALECWLEDENKPLENRRKFVFVIDEINRGEISKVFGELFFSIDPSYRGKKGSVDTQYSNMREGDDKKFYVPENVYIIGTMNDIDRSVESFDFAMRRRFAWYEITAVSSQRMFDSENAWSGNKPDDDKITEIKNRMNNLNSVIADDEKMNLGKSYQIGGAYFLKYGLYENEADPFDKLWNNHLKPLLQEYLRGIPNATDCLNKLKEGYDSSENN